MLRLTLLALATTALAAPAPQATTLCNPVAIPQGPFQLKALNPVTQQTTGLTIGEVSRGANILVGTADGTLNGAASFTYDYSSPDNFLCASNGGLNYGCDDGSTNNPLLFGQPGPVVDNGGITLKVGNGCFHEHDQQPLFAVGGENGDGAGTSAEDNWAGWVFCGAGNLVGIYWNGAGAPDAGCEKVGLQVFGY